eukprot:3924585-Prymnesium_polylepis.1
MITSNCDTNPLSLELRVWPRSMQSRAIASSNRGAPSALATRWRMLLRWRGSMTIGKPIPFMPSPTRGSPPKREYMSDSDVLFVGRSGAPPRAMRVFSFHFSQQPL